MTKQDWIIENRDFYHVTQTSNIQSILHKGLQKGNDNPFGICVIRSAHKDILEYLCQMMLITTDELDFSVIRISPQTHSLNSTEIANDQVVEVTNPLHNYIRRKVLKITPKDIIHQFRTTANNIQDLKVTEQRLIDLGIIESLD